MKHVRVRFKFVSFKTLLQGLSRGARWAMLATIKWLMNPFSTKGNECITHSFPFVEKGFTNHLKHFMRLALAMTQYGCSIGRWVNLITVSVKNWIIVSPQMTNQFREHYNQIFHRPNNFCNDSVGGARWGRGVGVKAVDLTQRLFKEIVQLHDLLCINAG